MWDVGQQYAGGTGSPFEAQRQAMYGNLGGFYGVTSQGPVGVSAFGNLPNLGGQFKSFMTDQFGPIGGMLSPLFNNVFKGLTGLNPAEMMPFGVGYDPGQFLLRQAPNQWGKPQFAPINYRTMDQSEFNSLADNDHLFNSLNTLTQGFNDMQGNQAWSPEAAQTAAMTANFLRGGGPIAGMANQILESLGLEDQQAVVPGVTAASNQFLGRARFMRGGPNNVNFSRYMAEGMIDRVNEYGSSLGDVGYKRSGEALQTLGASRMLDVGGLHQSTNLDKQGIEELRRKALDQVEEISSILEVGKELGLKVDQTLSAFQSFTGGNLTEILRRAGDQALAALPAGSTREERMDAVHVAKEARAEQISNKFRDEQIRAELAGTDMSQILTMSTAGAAALRQKTGVSGLEGAVRQQVLGLTEQASGLGLTDKQILNQATGAVETFMGSRSGRAGAVLLSNVERGILDSSDPAVAAAVSQFKATGQISVEDVRGLMANANLTNAEMITAFSDQGVNTAYGVAGVAEGIQRAMTRNENINLTGTLRKSADQILGPNAAAGDADILIAAKASGNAELYLDDLGRGDLKSQYRRFSAVADVAMQGDPRFGSTEAGVARLRLEAMDPEEMEKRAATQRKFENLITDTITQEAIKSRLVAAGVDEDTAADIAADPDKVRARIDSLEEMAKTFDKAGNTAGAKALRTQIADLKSATTPAHKKDMLEKLGEVFTAIGEGGMTGAKAAELQTVFEDLTGMERDESRALILEKFAVRDKDDNIIGVKNIDLTGMDEDTLTQLVKSLDAGFGRTVTEEEKEAAENRAAAREEAAKDEEQKKEEEEEFATNLKNLVTLAIAFLKGEGTTVKVVETDPPTDKPLEDGGQS